jgi:hypothetical protein
MFRKIVPPQLFAVLFISLLLPYTALAQNVDRRTGEWHQYVLTDEGSWRLLGAFNVQQQNGVFVMAPVAQLRDTGVTNSRGLFDLRYTATEWSFHSDWGNGNIAVFRLNKIDPGVYQGWAFLGEKRMNRNLWALVK